VPISVVALETERLCGFSISPFSSPNVVLGLRRDVDIRFRRLVGVGMPGD
jgi:uncharacterized protein involved in copper resistance